MCENFLRFRPFGPELWAKRIFPKSRLSHFFHIFYVEANVRISYMDTFFEAMVLKLCTGYLVHITEYVLNFFAILSIRARIMGKKGFSKVGLSYFFYVEANVRIFYMGTFFECMVLKICTGYLVNITESV